MRIFSVLAILFNLTISACTTTDASLNASVYREVNPSKNYSYGFSDDSEVDSKHGWLLPLALDYFNERLPGAKLSQAEDPDVAIAISEVSDELTAVSHTNLLGCMDGIGAWFECSIELKIFDQMTLKHNLARFLSLYKQGPLDEILKKSKTYPELNEEYLQDKLILLSLIHEIGHTLGMAHTVANDSGCIMAPLPEGNATLCEGETLGLMAKLRLASALPDKSRRLRNSYVPTESIPGLGRNRWPN